MYLQNFFTDVGKGERTWKREFFCLNLGDFFPLFRNQNWIIKFSSRKYTIFIKNIYSCVAVI